VNTTPGVTDANLQRLGDSIGWFLATYGDGDSVTLTITRRDKKERPATMVFDHDEMREAGRVLAALPHVKGPVR
jgi:hypothetical protein